MLSCVFVCTSGAGITVMLDGHAGLEKYNGVCRKIDVGHSFFGGSKMSTSCQEILKVNITEAQTINFHLSLT